MNTIIIKADNKSTKALVALFEAFGVVFEVKKEKEEKSPYDPTFVNKVLKASKDKGLKEIDPSNPWKSLGLV